MPEKDCFIMAQGAYMTDFDDDRLSMSRSKTKAMALEKADADEMLTVIPAACVVRIDGSDVMNYPNILDIFRAVTSNDDVASAFEEKYMNLPDELVSDQEAIKTLIDTTNKLFHRASFDPAVANFWEQYGEHPRTPILLEVIARAEAMIIFHSS